TLPLGVDDRSCDTFQTTGHNRFRSCCLRNLLANRPHFHIGSSPRALAEGTWRCPPGLAVGGPNRPLDLSSTGPQSGFPRPVFLGPLIFAFAADLLPASWRPGRRTTTRFSAVVPAIGGSSDRSINRERPPAPHPTAL